MSNNLNESPQNGPDPCHKLTFNLLSEKERLIYAENLMKEHKDRVPIILDKHKDATFTFGSGKKIMLVLNTLKLVNYLEFLRRKIKLNESAGLYVFIDGKHLARTGDLFGELYQKYAKKDKFLYITISDKEDKG